jgi:hypothetical protein
MGNDRLPFKRVERPCLGRNEHLTAPCEGTSPELAGLGGDLGAPVDFLDVDAVRLSQLTAHVVGHRFPRRIARVRARFPLGAVNSA